MEDKGILSLLRQRDEAAISEVKRKYGAFCYRIARDLLDAREDAEECVNDALLALWQAIPPACPSSIQAFLGRVIRNLAISRFRKAAAGKRGGGLACLLEELEDCLPDSQSLEAQVDSAALSKVISGWLYTLPPGDRRLFVLRYWYGRSVSELAGQLDKTPKELSQRTFRLRQKLKKVLEKEGYFI